MGSGEVAIVALSTMISLKVTFSDGLGGRANGERRPARACGLRREKAYKQKNRTG